MNSTIQSTIDAILEKRRLLLPEIGRQADQWQQLASRCENACRAMQEAERLNPESLQGLSDQLSRLAGDAQREAGKYQQIAARFGRNDLCIGIGGAARMGKSTFLQAVTGLGEEQLPTSDSYYTTATRSLVVNSTRNVAEADMHTPYSFIDSVLKPMLDALHLPAPSSLDEFAGMVLALPGKAESTQRNRDILKRLQDTQRALPLIRPELTGTTKREIPLAGLYDYVAYPRGGDSKAGKFMAVANLTIYASFPDSAVKQLRVVDLPGLGEAGRNLADVQTRGMADLCDMTLLMKRPDASNVDWKDDDSAALDAMKAAAPLVQDQTRYTAILANVDGDSPERAEACLKQIEKYASDSDRHFTIIRCQANDRPKVLASTMPQILQFLAANLPVVDEAIIVRANRQSEELHARSKSVFEMARQRLAPLAMTANDNSITFRDRLHKELVDNLSRYADELRVEASSPDDAWNNEVATITERVKQWVDGGCGYGSKDQLVAAIGDEILAGRGQPRDVINQLRIAFREQWEVMDDHLRTRIAQIIRNFIKCIADCTCSFVPPVADESVDGLREELRKIADKLEATPGQQPGDEVMLQALTRPLRRLSQFDLRFRFHLEPTLVAATDVLVSNQLPQVDAKQDAEKFTSVLMDMLKNKANEYSRAMCTSRGISEAAKEKKKRLIESSVYNPAVQRNLLEMLEKNTNDHTFSPNRIFAAVVESTTDAFVRSKDSKHAIEIWARGYGSELRQEPAPAQKAALNAYMKLNG